MVQLKSLMNKPSNKQVFAVVESPTGPITIFEPTSEDVAAIMNMHELVDYFNQDSDEKTDNFPITGVRVIRELYPLLTDLEGFDDMSDDEIQEVIDNPTIELMNVNAYINSLIYRVYILMVLTYKSNLRLQGLEKLTAEVSDETMNMIVETASKTDQGRDAINTMETATEKLKEKQTEKDTKDSDGKEPPSKEDSETPKDNVVSMSYKERLENSMRGKFEDVDQ